MANTVSKTKVFGDKSKARVLVIGHDPSLQKSATVAEYCFFADYFFRPIPARKSELAKYNLAKKLFCYLDWLTSGSYAKDEFIVTNLCNNHIDRLVKGKTVLIPEDMAKEGLSGIKQIILSSRIKLIIAMSQQVNYLLQKLGFYTSTEVYMKKSEPNKKCAEMRYYVPTGKSPFLEICGNKYLADGIPLFPVLHVKNCPLSGRFKSNYYDAHLRCIDLIKQLMNEN